LDAAVAVRALADRHAEGADDRPLDRQLFLILQRHSPPAHGMLAPRTVRRQRRLIRLVDVPRRAALSPSTIGRPRLAAGAPRRGGAGAAREWRGLSIDRATRRLEFLFQCLVLTPQALPLRLRAAQVLAQALDLARLIVDDLLGIARWCLGPSPRHAIVIAKARSKYKYEILDSVA